MEYPIYQYLWYFFIYSFAGWCAGVIVAALRKHSFINTGFLNLPLCPVYGIGAVLFAIFLTELRGHLFFVFLGGAILAAGVTYLTGVMLDRIFHKKWWDYSKYRFQFEGYIHLPNLLLWGTAAVLCIYLMNPLIDTLLPKIPLWVQNVALGLLGFLVCVDFISAAAAVLQLRVKLGKLGDLSRDLQVLSDSVGNGITRRIQRRMLKAYPNIREAGQKEQIQSMVVSKVFARGCCFYKLVWLFLLGAFLGDIVETIFCYVTMGKWMSRSSVVYGPFSIVWGLACAFLTALLYKYKNKSVGYLFLYGMILGGAYEYICSVFTEMVFGTIFWDYSGLPFNLGGRINLLFCFFWGIAAVVWLKAAYPLLSNLIEKIPRKAGPIVTWVLLVFMAVNMVVSSMALGRYSARQNGKPASNPVEVILDERFDDTRMERIYPNAKQV